MTLKHCRCCGLDKPIDAFGRNAKRPDGLQDHCKPCRSEAAAKAWADFRAAFVGPLWPHGLRRDRVANAGRLKPPATPKRPRPMPAGDGRPSPRRPKLGKASTPPPVRPMTSEEIAKAEAFIAAHRASAAVAGNAAGSQPKGYRKSNFHRIADAEQARADGIETAPASSVADDLQARREAALAAAASMVSSVRPVGRVVFVPPSRS